MNQITDSMILNILENEAIYILQETFAQFKNPVILFSGGKDSLVVSHLALKAIYPQKKTIVLLHINTGHNFDETITFRDQWSAANNFHLVVRNVEDTMAKEKSNAESSILKSRNSIQSTTLMEAIHELKIDAAIGGARRDEERARAKEKIFSHRNKAGSWKPENQHPEFFNCYFPLLKKNEHYRIFPLSNWTEEDIWLYILKEKLPVPALYFSHQRKCIVRDHAIYALSNYIQKNENDKVKKMQIRYRTVGDTTCTSALISNAKTIEEILLENKKIKISERGTRMDDKLSAAAMEERKLNGYF